MRTSERLEIRHFSTARISLAIVISRQIYALGNSPLHPLDGRVGFRVDTESVEQTSLLLLPGTEPKPSSTRAICPGSYDLQ
jgi:hypothetical protein